MSARALKLKPRGPKTATDPEDERLLGSVRKLRQAVQDARMLNSMIRKGSEGKPAERKRVS
jgi:hypothetical protein